MPTRNAPHRPRAAAIAAAARPNSHQRGYNRRWRTYRLAFLRKHPFCRHCEEQGRVVAATEVDHIVPHRGDSALFWSKSNHQPLCKRHHSAKTARETNARR